MRILSIGDFHGKFPAKLKKLAKQVDLVVSVGDYFPNSLIKTFFKYCYGRDVELWDVIGKKKYKESRLKDFERGEDGTLKFLGGLDVPVITVPGNADVPLNDQYTLLRFSPPDWKWVEQDFLAKILKKYPKIKRFEYSYTKVGDLIFIGGFGHSSPGMVKSKAYRKYKKKLDALFKKFRKENREGRVVFVAHNMPYDTRLDKIRWKGADPRARGKHYGSKLVRRIINKWQPVLFIGGHHHENQGREKLGRTIVMNSGAAHDGQAAIIDFDEAKGKVKRVEFVK